MNKELKLISEAYINMLQSKTKMSITEEQLDKMTQEEFDAIDEEQLNELSKQTYKNYLNKIGPKLKDDEEEVDFQRDRGQHDGQPGRNWAMRSGLDLAHKQLNRTKASIKSATSKLTKKSS